MTSIEPLGALILISEIKKEDRKTSSGLVLTSDTLDSELNRGVIVAMGPGERNQDGVTLPIPLNIGDTIIYADAHATEVTDTKTLEKYHFINWRTLFGVEK
jgi:chaperonin GroES